VVADAREGRATPHRRPVSSLVVAPLRRVAKDALARGDHARAAAAAALVLTVTMRARGGDGGGAIASAGQRARARGGSRETKEEHAAAERDAIDVALAVFRATKTEGGETPDVRALQPYSPHARRPPPAPAVRLPPPPRGAVAASGGSRAMTTFTADDEIRLLELKRAASARGTTENEDDVVAVALAYVALKDDPDRAIAELTRRERLAVRRGVRGGDQFVRQDTPARRRAMALCLHAKYVKETKAGRGAADDARLTRAADDARLALVDAFEECPDAVDVASALVKMLEARGDDAIARDVAARCAACAPGDLHAQTRHARLCERARVAALEASLEAEDAERRLRRRSFTTSTMSRSRSKSKSKSKSRTGTPRSRASSGDGSDTSSDSSSSSEEDGGGRGGLFSGSSEDEEDLEEVTAAARKRANDAAAAAPSPDELAAAHLAVLRLDALDVSSLAGLIRARNLGAKKVRDRVVLERVAARVDASIAAAEKVGVGAVRFRDGDGRRLPRAAQRRRRRRPPSRDASRRRGGDSPIRARVVVDARGVHDGADARKAPRTTTGTSRRHARPRRAERRRDGRARRARRRRGGGVSQPRVRDARVRSSEVGSPDESRRAREGSEGRRPSARAGGGERRRGGARRARVEARGED
jgi:hypothetical protein